MRIFFITGASIGIVGTLAGLALGVLVCAQHRADPRVRRLDHRHRAVLAGALLSVRSCRPSMDTGETASVVIMALVLSILATLYPSWRASRLDPVEALRYE